MLSPVILQNESFGFDLKEILSTGAKLLEGGGERAVGGGGGGCNLGGLYYSWLNTFVKNLPFRKNILMKISEVTLGQNCIRLSDTLNDLYFSEIFFIKSSENMLRT